MSELIKEREHAVLKGTLQQWWRVGPLQLMLEITDQQNPKFKRFDEPQCFVAYNRLVEGGGEYDSPDEGYPNFTALCKEHDIPFVIDRTDWQQNQFYIPAARTMQFMEALEEGLESKSI